MDLNDWLLPVLSLIGGAAGAAIINFGFGLWKLKADRKDEHSRWLRDQRQVAYADYLGSTRRLFEWVSFEGFARLETRDELLTHLGKVETALVRLLAPNEVRDAADAVYRSLHFLMISKMPLEGDLERGFYSEKEAAKRYSETHEELLRLCRADLGRRP